MFNILKKKCQLPFDEYKDMPVCTEQAEGMIGFAEIIMKKAIELNGGQFDYEYRDLHKNPFYQIYFDAQQIRDFMKNRKKASYG